MVEMQDFKNRLIETGVVNQKEIKGCTEALISVFEKERELFLPLYYREFLKKFGLNRGGFLSRLDCSFDLLDRINNRFKEEVIELSSEEFDLKVPLNSFVICSDGAEYFTFILASKNAIDSPVFCMDRCLAEIYQTHSSIIDWLEELVLEYEKRHLGW